FFPDDRLQQVFGAADFRDAGAPLRITELSFAAYDRPIDVTLPNIAIHVSTTSKPVDGLSATFAQNIGPDDTVVFSGPLHFFQSGTGPSGFSGEIYDIHIELQTPYVYDSAQGNLLVDFFNYQSLPPAP